ncbi:MAG: tetratricopeptide repeat protein, partial [Rhodanobacteraceae bacterium]
SDDGLRKAIDQYNAAVRIDPHYALAYAMMSSAWVVLAGNAERAQAQQYYAKARDAANTALDLEPTLAFAHLARGFLLYSADFDWSGAQAEYQSALQLAPNNGNARVLLAELLATMGQTERAIELTRQALLTDPMSGYAYGSLSGYYMQLGHLDEAERAIRTKKSLGAQFDINVVLANLEILRGNARAAWKYASQLAPGPWHDISMAMALSIGDDRAAADAALKTVIDKYGDGGPFQIAEIYALRKQPDKMFEWLDRAWTQRDTGVAGLLNSPFLLRYKDDPRFAAFCRKVGLPPPGTASPDVTSTTAGTASTFAP